MKGWSTWILSAAVTRFKKYYGVILPKEIQVPILQKMVYYSALKSNQIIPKLKYC